MASRATVFNDVYFPGYGQTNRLAASGAFAQPDIVGQLNNAGDASASTQAQQDAAKYPSWLTDITARGLGTDWTPAAHVNPDVISPVYGDMTPPPVAAAPVASAPAVAQNSPNWVADYGAGGPGDAGGGEGTGDSGASAGAGATGDASSDSGASAGSDSGSDGGGPGGGGGASGDGGGPGGGGGDGSGGDGGGFSRGGLVTRNRLAGPDPDGPDEGYAALKAGEAVLTAKAVKHYGPAFIARLNRLAVPKRAPKPDGRAAR